MRNREETGSDLHTAHNLGKTVVSVEINQHL